MYFASVIFQKEQFALRVVIRDIYPTKSLLLRYTNQLMRYVVQRSTTSLRLS